MYADPLIMTPGPTMIHEKVRLSAAKPIVNPDIDPDFALFYENLSSNLQKIFSTKNPLLIMCGEGMLALEAAVVSLIEPGDTVLCLDNGVFGHGFIELVEMYGGKTIVLSKDYRIPFSAEEIENCLKQNPQIQVATLVHCETPTGLLNPLHLIGPILSKHGVLSIVDAVSSIGGEVVLSDSWKLDVVLAASQKCLSSTPGLSLLSVSPQAWEKIHRRKKPIPGYYMNLNTWKTMWLENREFPYTQSVSDLYALDTAAIMALQEGDDLFLRHQTIARGVRSALAASGFEIFPVAEAASNTVTALLKPEPIPDHAFRAHMWNRYGVLMAGTFGPMEGKLWRIGHMGENARENQVYRFFRAFEDTLADFSYSPKLSLAASFADFMRTHRENKREVF